MNYTNYFNLNKPERAEQYNLDHWNENSDTIDGALAGLQNLTDQTFKTALLNFCYPVGSLYWSSNSTNPATLFGGTWTQIKDKFIWAKGDSDTVNATGGAKTVTLTEANLPSHSHKLNNGNTSSSGTLTTAGFRFASGSTGAMSANSAGKLPAYNVSSNNSDHGNLSLSQSQYSSGNYGGIYTLNTDFKGALTLNVAHTHSITSFQGYLYGSTDTTGSGTAVNKMPPYVVKYCWERTA